MKKIFCLLLGCGKQEFRYWESLKIEEGQHRSTPYRLTWNDDSYLYYEWYFSALSVYELGDIDQCDWNKLTGVSFHLASTTNNSLLVAWRYDRAGFFWVAPYYHQSGNTYWSNVLCTDFHVPNTPDETLVAIRADFGDIIETHINIVRDMNCAAVTIINQTTGETSFFEVSYDFELEKIREVYPWFGGNETAPNDIYLSRRLMARE